MVSRQAFINYKVLAVSTQRDGLFIEGSSLEVKVKEDAYGSVTCCSFKVAGRPICYEDSYYHPTHSANDHSSKGVTNWIINAFHQRLAGASMPFCGFVYDSEMTIPYVLPGWFETISGLNDYPQTVVISLPNTLLTEHGLRQRSASKKETAYKNEDEDDFIGKAMKALKASGIDESILPEIEVQVRKMNTLNLTMNTLPNLYQAEGIQKPLREQAKTVYSYYCLMLFALDDIVDRGWSILGQDPGLIKSLFSSSLVASMII